MTTLATLTIGIFIGAFIAEWRHQGRATHAFDLGVEAQKDAEALGASKAHHPAYAGPPPLTVVPMAQGTNVIDIADRLRRQGPDPAA